MTTISISPRIVAKELAAQLLSISVKTFERLVQQGELPKPRQISAGRVGWLVSELDAWAEKRPVSDLLPPPNTGAPKPRKSAVNQVAACSAA